MRRTFFNEDQGEYEIKICENDYLAFRTEGEEILNNGMIFSPMKRFVSGTIIDTLAKYEDTGLTPSEIRELQGDTLKKLKESNEILRKNNDEYFIEYQKLLDENHILKSLLKNWLDLTT